MSGEVGYVHGNADVLAIMAQAAAGDGKLPNIDGEVEVDEALREVEGEMDDEEEEVNIAEEAQEHDPAEVWGLNSEVFAADDERSTYMAGKGVRHPEAVSPGDVAVESQHSILWRLVPFGLRHALQRTFTPAVVVAANHAMWFTIFAVAFSYPKWVLVPMFNICSIVFAKSIELLPKYQAISRQGVAYYEPTMAYLQTHGASSLDPQYIDLRDYRGRETHIPERDDPEVTLIDDDLEYTDEITNVIADDRDLIPEELNPYKQR